MALISQTQFSSKVATWRGTLAGLLPVLIFSLATALEGTSSQAFLTAWLTWAAFLMLSALPVIGILAAWERGFPRWSAPYFGLLVLDIPLIGLIFFTRIIDNPWGLWSLRAGLIVLLLIFVFYILKRLIEQPVGGDISVDHDVLQFFFGVHVLIPLSWLFILDEIAVAYKTPVIVLCGIILAGGALVYLRSRQMWLRGVSLLASVLVALLLAYLAATLYWGNYSGGMGF